MDRNEPPAHQPIRVAVDPIDGRDDGVTDAPTQPVQSLHAAQAIARRLIAAGHAVEVLLAGGIHRLRHTLDFTPADGGQLGAPVHWRAAPDAFPVISGGQRITGWQVEGDGVWSAATGAARVHHLWINGRRARRARWPATERLHIRSWDLARRVVVLDLPTTALPVETAAALAGSTLITGNHFTSNRLHIASARVVGTSLELSIVDTQAIIWTIAGPFRGGQAWIEGHRAFLTTPGTWHHDAAAGVVRYHALPDEDPASPTFAAEAPHLDTVLRIAGDARRPVRALTFTGMAVQHAGWAWPNAHGCIEFQAGRVFSPVQHEQAESDAERSFAPPAAISIRDADAVTFSDCAVANVAATGIEHIDSTTRCRITGCLIRDCGGNGIVIGRPTPDDAPAHGDWSSVPTWRPCRDDVVEDCRIEDVGQDHRGGVGICVGVSQGVRIARNRIARTPYTGLSVGWGWSECPSIQGATTVVGNVLHGMMYDRALHDGGGIYTLGAQAGTTIRDNVVCLHRGKGAIYFDEGSGPIAASGNQIETGTAMVHSSARTFGNSLSGGWSTTARMTRNAAGTDPAVEAVACAPYAAWPADVRSMVTITGPQTTNRWADRLLPRQATMRIDLDAGWMDGWDGWVPGPRPGTMAAITVGTVGIIRFRGTRLRLDGELHCAAGVLRVSLDGAEDVVVNLCRAQDAPTTATILDTGPLPLADHVMRLVITDCMAGVRIGPGHLTTGAIG